MPYINHSGLNLIENIFFFVFYDSAFSHTIYVCTHELINLHISAMAYYINTLDGERSGHGRCEPKYLKDGDLF